MTIIRYIPPTSQHSCGGAAYQCRGRHKEVPSCGGASDSNGSHSRMHGRMDKRLGQRAERKASYVI
jgi:hypothetical protein